MVTTTTPKTPAAKKPQTPAVTRVSDLLKRSALQGKLTQADLDTVSNLALALKTFLAA